MENKDEFLPLGSIVLLKEAKRKIAIIGFGVVEDGSMQIWDYLGVPYPIGTISSDKNLLFNRNQIDKVIFKGYLDDEGLLFSKELKKSLERMR